MGLSILASITDPYDRQARLYPALLAGLPVIVMMTVLYGSNSLFTAACTVAASCGGLYLLGNIARERGRRLEPTLFERWGGKPSTQLLRHRDQVIEAPTKHRYHVFLSRALNLQFPDEKEEEVNPLKADDVYQSAVRWLLNNTRDKNKYKMIFTENITYGFRRNALGLKWLAVLICLLTTGWVIAFQNIMTFRDGLDINMASVSTATTISLVVPLTMILVWLLFFTKENVRNAAFVYAETLLRACDQIASKPGKR